MKIKLLAVLLLTLQHNCYSQKIRLESVQSVYIQVFYNNTRLGSATAFIIRSKTQNYLVTNYHVITDRNPVNNKMLDTVRKLSPNRIAILYNGKELGTNVMKFEKLFGDRGEPLWHQNKIDTEMVDVVELPLKDTSQVAIYPVNYTNIILDGYGQDIDFDKMLIQPTDQVFILGYPLGIMSSPAFPVWRSGIIASEPAIYQENKPIIWVDAITFPGMSGSPVYLITSRLKYKDGTDIQSMGNSHTFFLGVFSHAQPNQVYGALWNGSYLKSIFSSLP